VYEVCFWRHTGATRMLLDSLRRHWTHWEGTARRSNYISFTDTKFTTVLPKKWNTLVPNKRYVLWNLQLACQKWYCSPQVPSEMINLICPANTSQSSISCEKVSSFSSDLAHKTLFSWLICPTTFCRVSNLAKINETQFNVDHFIIVGGGWAPALLASCYK